MSRVPMAKYSALIMSKHCQLYLGLWKLETGAMGGIMSSLRRGLPCLVDLYNLLYEACCLCRDYRTMA
jgi:hypothetical protein